MEHHEEVRVPTNMSASIEMKRLVIENMKSLTKSMEVAEGRV
jgi:hypothetical protein